MRTFSQHITEAKKTATKQGKSYTFCDLLADPDPKKFVAFMNDDMEKFYRLTGHPELNDTLTDPKWVNDLLKAREPFEDWFESVGGTKRDKAKMVALFKQLVSCKNRAAWASWKGMAYRGLSREASHIKRYNFTGKVKVMGGEPWLVAKGTYRSRYDAQSWTDNFNVAKRFAMGGGGLAVVLEVELKKSDTLLSVDVIHKISPYGIGFDQSEREVIRVGNQPLPVTIYVRASDIEDELYLLNIKGNSAVRRRMAASRNKRSEARSIVLDKAYRLLGVRGAEAFSETKPFDDLVDEVLRR